MKWTVKLRVAQAGGALDKNKLARRSAWRFQELSQVHSLLMSTNSKTKPLASAWEVKLSATAPSSER